MRVASDTDHTRLHAILRELDITPTLLASRGLTLHCEPPHLVDVPPISAAEDSTGPFQLTPTTCSAWLAMQKAAQEQGVPLALVSAFRSVDRQREIIAAKRGQGQTIAEILASVAPPGYSEHHTGRAIDIGTTEAAALEEVFETTASFAWLTQHAHAFGFVMSFPRNNRQGFVFEPWHWCYQDT